MSEIAALEDFFRSRQVLFAPTWLESCVNWCKEENLPSNYTIKDLQFKVFEQWLLLDLRDVEIPCLPPNLSAMINYTLTGTYCVQVMEIIDTSKPKHWQLMRIRKGIQKNLEQDKESSKRALLITLSDGVQEVKAMEYQPIKCLNLNLSPGIKVRLMGPIQLRRGRLMLQENNIKILGGEVDSLIVSNAAENILAKQLNLPLNPHPLVIQESILTADTTELTQTGEPGNSGIVTNLTNDEFSNQPLPNNNRAELQPTNQIDGFAGFAKVQPVPANSSRQQSNVVETKYHEKLENDDQRIDDEINMMMEVERELEESSSKIRKPNEIPDEFGDTDLDDAAFENIQIPDKSKLSENVHEQSDFFVDMDLDAHLDKIDNESKSSTSSQPKVWTIEKLSKSIPNVSNGKFKIKAKFRTVVEKMSVVGDEFFLVINVCDQTGNIDVRLHTDVVAEFFGHSATYATAMKVEIAQNNAEAKTKMIECLGNLKDQLTNLDRIAEVQVKTGEKYPVVLRFL